MKKLAIFIVAAAMLLSVTTVFAKKDWDGIVHAPLKTAQPNGWSAPDVFFTGEESGSIKYTHVSDTFNGVLELDGFNQAGPYVLTVDTADKDENTLAGLDCDIWKLWAEYYGESFEGGTNGCWNDDPYVDVKLFTLSAYTEESTGETYYKGIIPFDTPLLDGEYNLKFFIKLDWHITSPSNNIMMMNDMTGDPRYGKVVQPKNFSDFTNDYAKDLIINGKLGNAAERLVLADDAWCVPLSWCIAPDQDPGYQGTTGVVFYKKVSNTFEGTVVLSNTVTPPTPQPLQIKLEGLGSLNGDAVSNEEIGYIGRWWDNTAGANILSDGAYEAVKELNDVLGYIVFDGYDTTTTTKEFSLNSSYHTLPMPQSGRPSPGNVVMVDGDYDAYFALTENIWAYRGVFLSENPVEFTIAH